MLLSFTEYKDSIFFIRETFYFLYTFQFQNKWL